MEVRACMHRSYRSAAATKVSPRAPKTAPMRLCAIVAASSRIAHFTFVTSGLGGSGDGDGDPPGLAYAVQSELLSADAMPGGERDRGGGGLG